MGERKIVRWEEDSSVDERFIGGRKVLTRGKHSLMEDSFFRGRKGPSQNTYFLWWGGPPVGDRSSCGRMKFLQNKFCFG